MAFFRPRLLSADESGSAFQRTGLAGSWLVAGVELAARRREPLGGPLGGVAEQRRDAGTFRESLRLTDSRARAADRQENRPTFTGWSGYPTHLFVCDRDGMTVRAADHRDNTSVRMTSRLSSVVKRPHRCACLGAAVAVPGRHTETIAEGVDDDDEPDEDRDRTGQEGT